MSWKEWLINSDLILIVPEAGMSKMMASWAEHLLSGSLMAVFSLCPHLVKGLRGSMGSFS